MKLTVIGAGVRAPLFAAAAIRRASRIGLEELWLMDVDAERLALFSAVVRQQVRSAASDLRIKSSTDPEAAVDGAAHLVTTIRVGGEEGRVLDERIALQHGVLGQETTGPGGFAMAMRNIPAILGYAELLERRSPGAWLYSFTNPAGMVAQALRDSGYERSIGICDGANGAKQAVAEYLRLDAADLEAEVFGLNHLSWARRVTGGGVDLLADLLPDVGFRAATSLSMFAPDLVRLLGMWPNPYLHYYYEAEQALASIAAEAVTRGEEIRDLTARLIDDLTAIDPERNPDAALRRFRAYHRRRGATYMAHARDGAPSLAEADRLASEDENWGADDEEGYAGVMLDVVEALETGRVLDTALNVPNHGAIDGLDDDDVVEVSCRVDRDGVRPIAIGRIPEPQLALIRSVKAYERLAVRAIVGRSRDIAVEALMTHPLVMSYPRASALVDSYLAAHHRFVDWDRGEHAARTREAPMTPSA
jgi:6-phospho-beta-glucosidase